MRAPILAIALSSLISFVAPCPAHSEPAFACPTAGTLTRDDHSHVRCYTGPNPVDPFLCDSLDDAPGAHTAFVPSKMGGWGLEGLASHTRELNFFDIGSFDTPSLRAAKTLFVSRNFDFTMQAITSCTQ